MGEDHLFEPLIGFGIADDRGEGRDAGAGREEIEPLAGRQSVVDQRAGRLAAEQDLVARLDELELRGQRAVGNLDREEFQFLVPARARDGIGAQQRFAGRAFEADHDELARAEAEGRWPRDPEGEHPVGVVFHRQDGFLGRRIGRPNGLSAGLSAASIIRFQGVPGRMGGTPDGGPFAPDGPRGIACQMQLKARFSSRFRAFAG